MNVTFLIFFLEMMEEYILQRQICGVCVQRERGIVALDNRSVTCWSVHSKSAILWFSFVF